ncbi:MAG: hypothetical protein CMK50_04010 [Propionibacteriaceae bacterium]|nr:hypothetical protein [Propionibacteriaceae bacterium]
MSKVHKLTAILPVGIASSKCFPVTGFGVIAWQEDWLCQLIHLRQLQGQNRLRSWYFAEVVELRRSSP